MNYDEEIISNEPSSINKQLTDNALLSIQLASRFVLETFAHSKDAEHSFPGNSIEWFMFIEFRLGGRIIAFVFYTHPGLQMATSLSY